MNPAGTVIDLDDVDGLLGADRDGLLRGVSMAGAQVRATDAAVADGALDSVDDQTPPRTVVWAAGRGAAQAAGGMLAAALAGEAAEPVVVAAEAPPWLGALDVLIIAGDDPGDPALARIAAVGARRGARVVVAAPYEGPLRDATAGRAAVLEPRIRVPDEFGLSRYLAVGLAVLGSVDARLRTDLAALADELDAEVLRNSVGREVFTNTAKTLAGRFAGHRITLAGDCAPTMRLCGHISATLLRIAGTVTAAAGLADAVVALHAHAGAVDDIFHDDEFDGPSVEPLRVFALTLAAEREMVAARIGGFADADLVGVQDVVSTTETPDVFAEASRAGRIGQLAVLAARLEMAAVYLRLVRG